MPRISANDCVHRRGGHVTWFYRNQLLVWGGFFERLDRKPLLPNSIPTNGNDFHTNAQIYAMDMDSLSWKWVTCTGDIPPRSFCSASCVVDHLIYVYGGYYGYEDDYYYENGSVDQLFCLDLDTFCWRKLPRSAHPPLGVEKSSLVHCQDFLYLYGGYGEAPKTNKFYPGEIMFDLDPATEWSWQRGWFGNLWVFSLHTETWNWCNVKGNVPRPRAGHSLVVHEERAFIFGGRTSTGRSNEVFALDLRLQSWCKISEGSTSMPEPRSAFSFCKYNSHQAFLYGGMGNLCTPLNDAWIFNFLNLTWTEVPLSYDHGQIRCYQGSVSTSESEVIIHSGLTQEYYLNRVQLDQHPQRTLLKFQLGVPKLSIIAADHIIKAKLALEDLPTELRVMLQKRRLNGDIDYGDIDHFDEEQFDRTTIHAGI